MATTFDITSGSVAASLGYAATSSATIFNNTDFLYNFAVAGCPFISAVSANDPFVRGFAQVRRTQTDTAQVPGEQSLDSWWLRSQFDWSQGAGQVLYEPANDPIIRSRFARSQGVDVWTAGQVTLLPDMGVLSASANNRVASARTAGGVDYVVYCNGTTTYKNDGTTQTAITGLTAQPSWLWGMGSKVLACHATGIDVIDVSGSTGTSLVTAAASAPKVWFVKQRLMIAVGAALHEKPVTGGALATALYTHPDASWVWSSVVETPGAILAAGYNGSKGAIYRFELTATGTLPAMSAAITTAEFPQGEWPTGMISYLGSYVAIGTNKGVRIAVAQDNGQLQYGPLSLETSYPVEHFTANDSYVFCGVRAGQVDGTSGLARIDLGAPDSTGRYAWAMDVACGDSGAITGVTHLGASGRVVVASSSVWLQSATVKVAAGWLETAATLFGTLELKQFVSILLKATIPGGLLAVGTMNGGVETSLLTFAGAPDQEVSVSPALPVDRLTLKFTMTRGTDTTISPVLQGWQVRALPLIARKEIIQAPLLCYDCERDAAGNVRYGSAWDRYVALRDAVANRATVTFQNLDTGEVSTGVVEDFSFKQLAPPEGFDGFGGFITISVRVL